jgi:hypothetical protein
MTPTPSYEILLVANDFVQDRWEEISMLLKSAFTGATLPAGFSADRPAKHTWEELHKPGRDGLEHVVAVAEGGRLLGAIFCVPTQRPEEAITCDVGWFFTVATLPGSKRLALSNAMVTRVHEVLAEAGYEAVVTEMGTEDGGIYLSCRHGYVPAPTAERKNRWIRGLRKAVDRVVSRNSEKRAWKNEGEQLARYATVDIAEGEVIIDLKILLKRARRASVNTMQIAEGFHYRSSEGNLCMNHHCSPNGYICFDDLTYRSLRDISTGEELTFNYCATEYELAEPFDCLCGSPDCLGRVLGFKFLDECQAERIHDMLSPYLRSKAVGTLHEGIRRSSNDEELPRGRSRRIAA